MLCLSNQDPLSVVMSAIAMLLQFMTFRVNPNCHVSQSGHVIMFAMLTCCHVLPELFTRMLPPSHGGTMTMTLEAPVS